MREIGHLYENFQVSRCCDSPRKQDARVSFKAQSLISRANLPTFHSSLLFSKGYLLERSPFSKLIRDCMGFALLRSVIGP